MYHFGNEHAECNVYLLRYLRKNSDKTGNSWSTEMIYLLADANSRRKELFLRDADVKFYNNDSERNLHKCKTHQKMSDGFRKESGSKLYCDIMSVIETCKKMQILESIYIIFAGKRAIYCPVYF